MTADECGLPMYPGGPRCDVVGAHKRDSVSGRGDVHGRADMPSVQWTYTACWQEHEPGRRCVLRTEHPPVQFPRKPVPYTPEALSHEEAIAAEALALAESGHVTVDAGVTAVFATFPGDTWRAAPLRDVIGAALGEYAPLDPEGCTCGHLPHRLVCAIVMGKVDVADG